jgi:hypothetical protein
MQQYCTHCGKKLTQAYDPVKYDGMTGKRLPDISTYKYCDNTYCTMYCIPVR